MPTGWRRDFPQETLELPQLKEVLEKAMTDGIYPRSFQLVRDTLFFMVEENRQSLLVVIGPLAVQFDGVSENIGPYSLKLCAQDNSNCGMLREVFPWAGPVAFGRQGASIGLGDRLGLASPGHIAALGDRSVRPVLAQQSIRELNLTGRDYDQVLNAATWAVLQEGYTKGFGADGDHLKEASEVESALDRGFSMITLDCSEYIDDTVLAMSPDQVRLRYADLSADLRSSFECFYLHNEFELASGAKLRFEPMRLMTAVLVYYPALAYARHIYERCLQATAQPVDFEVSIDEVATPTSPQDHFFVATELDKMGVPITSLAPRFCGEFQKGIDYIGDKNQFAQEFLVHAQIADHFGHKLSIHSGSDKFGVYPVIGPATKGRYHVKTAGTNWLEAMRVIAQKEPELYRDIHAFALANVDAARQYYHVTLEEQKIPVLDRLTNQQLPALMDHNDARQLLHITYGLILQAQDLDGTYRFRDFIYRVLHDYRDAYTERLVTHIGKHLDLLGS